MNKNGQPKKNKCSILTYGYSWHCSLSNEQCEQYFNEQLQPLAAHTYGSKSQQLLIGAVRTIAACATVVICACFCTGITDTTNWFGMWQWSLKHFFTYCFRHGAAFAGFIVVTAFCTKRGTKEEPRTCPPRNTKTWRLWFCRRQVGTLWKGCRSTVLVRSCHSEANQAR